MSLPTLTDVHQDAVLSQISIASMNQMTSFVADKAFPRIPVNKKSDSYYIYDQSYLLRSHATVRADKTEAPIRSHGLSTATYTANKYSVAELVSDDERKNADAPLDPDRDATEIVTHDLMLKREIEFASTAMTTSVWNNDVTPGTLWDASSPDIIGDVDTGKRTISTSTGIPSNMLSMVMSADVWDVVKRNSDILNAFGGGDARVKTASVDFVRQLLGLKNLWIMESAQNTATEGATASYSHLATKDALILFTPDRPSPRQPAAGYTFEFGSLEISRFRRPEKQADQIEGNMFFDQKATMSSAGYFLNAVIS